MALVAAEESLPPTSRRSKAPQDVVGSNIATTGARTAAAPTILPHQARREVVAVVESAATTFRGCNANAATTTLVPELLNTTRARTAAVTARSHARGSCTSDDAILRFGRRVGTGSFRSFCLQAAAALSRYYSVKSMNVISSNVERFDLPGQYVEI